MSGIQPSADYTDRDFDSIRLRLQALIRSAFPTWTDFNVTNFGNILLDLFSFVLDVLGFYQENQAGEAFIATATQRKNVIALAKLLGFSPSGAHAASANVAISLAAPPTADVILPAGSTCRTAEITDPIVFQLLSEVVFTAGMNPPIVNVDVENSISIEELFPSTALANQEIVLSSTPFLDASAVVTAANGGYTIVTDFLASEPGDRHFTIVVDNNDRATLRFGNGINGAIPLGSITVDYRTGGGDAANVEPNTITTFDGVWTDAQGNPVIVSVTNPLKASGGSPRATTEQIRSLAPATVRAANRTVSREDYEINARRVQGVARALMTTSNEDPGVTENHGILYVVPVGGGAPSSTLKDAVLTMVTVTYPNTITFQLAVQDPRYLVLNIAMVVFRAPKTTKAQAGSVIRAALAAFFAISLPDGTANSTIDFGFNYKNATGGSDGLIPIDQIFNAVRDLSVVRRMSDKDFEFTVNGAHRDVVIAPMEFPVLGTVSITDGDDGSTL